MGPHLMLRVCEHAALNDLSVGLYGGTPAALKRLRFEPGRMRCLVQLSWMSRFASSALSRMATIQPVT